MEEKEGKSAEKINEFISTISLVKNITVVDLSNQHLADIGENIVLPENLYEINLSHNKLTIVPQFVMCLQKLRKLNVSWNDIEYFDETPSFCFDIEELDISHNRLLGPPYWIWLETPNKLSKLDISNNLKITTSLNNDYLKELNKYKLPINEIVIHNCKLGHHIEILNTFSDAKSIRLGSDDLSYLSANVIEEVPTVGLDKCCNVERLNLQFTFICTILPSICMYETLEEVDLSQNKISSLPNEFCKLINLKVCILSCNYILYLPNAFSDLINLEVLCISSNALCMLPDNISKLKKLKTLDLYDNYLNEVPNTEMLDKVDLAQNYIDEPDHKQYLDKRNQMRKNVLGRVNGRKIEVTHNENRCSTDNSDNESSCSLNETNIKENGHELQNEVNSDSSEDWDSEDWWQPGNYQPCSATPAQTKWLQFVKRKMDEGNFCPSDVHTVSISEKVKYDKMCNPKIVKEVEGQFDDLSDDSS